MSRYRKHLPQLDGPLFLADGGLETTLIFHEGMELPCFASFLLLKDEAGRAALRRYFAAYATIARDNGTGLVLETPTWRANPDWGAKLGYDAGALDDANRKSISLLLEVRAEFETPATPIVVSGNLGPRGDGYQPSARMSADAARAYHARQVPTNGGGIPPEIRWEPLHELEVGFSSGAIRPHRRERVRAGRAR